MASSFLGEYSQKVDGKGRMSIPADFRAVLAEGDPDYPDKPLPRIIINYGPHLKGNLRAYTIEAMNEIEAGIKRMPQGSENRKIASFVYLAKTWRSEIDKDGRIVLPQMLREQIGLDGEARMIAMGEYFEIWNAETYAGSDGAEIEAWLAQQGPNFDPLTLVFPQEGG
ncbi:MAG: division/cell wall cluster transcriptional repressor MraZ [Roseovarius sp.]